MHSGKAKAHVIFSYCIKTLCAHNRYLLKIWIISVRVVLTRLSSLLLGCMGAMEVSLLVPAIFKLDIILTALLVR